MERTRPPCAFTPSPSVRVRVLTASAGKGTSTTGLRFTLIVSFNLSNVFKDPISKYNYMVSQGQAVRAWMHEWEGETGQPVTAQ